MTLYKVTIEGSDTGPVDEDYAASVVSHSCSEIEWSLLFAIERSDSGIFSEIIAKVLDNHESLDWTEEDCYRQVREAEKSFFIAAANYLKTIAEYRKKP